MTRLDFDADGRDWPHREASRFVPAGGLLWHVQVMGQGPPLLLIHGTGASSHSWRKVMTALAGAFTLIAPDLPGHAFTAPPRSNAGYTLPGMAEGLAALLSALDLKPETIAGHSAGAAIAIRLALDRAIVPKRIVSFNGALLPFPGLGAWAFPLLAKLLFSNPFAAPLMARRAAEPGAVERLIKGTGSTLDDQGIGYYRTLFTNVDHVAATLAMMSNWDLATFKRDLGSLKPTLTLAFAANDKAVPPSVAVETAPLVRRTRLTDLGPYGHLAHEEAPNAAAAAIRHAVEAE